MKHIPKKLSGFALKYIAMVSMLCDHANSARDPARLFAPFRGEDGSTLIPQNAPAWLGAVQGVYRVFDVLGHLAFRSMSSLLAEGFTHTRGGSGISSRCWPLPLSASRSSTSRTMSSGLVPRFKTYSLRSRSPAWNYSCCTH